LDAIQLHKKVAKKTPIFLKNLNFDEKLKSLKKSLFFDKK
jgi:hypothetical protein